MSRSDMLDGGCACGTVRYRMQGPPMIVHCCHCLDCQRQTGAGFAINAMIEADRVTLLSGEPELVPVPTDSGRPHVISRCPTCETAVWSTYGGRTWMRFVRGGTLDDPAAITPDVHIYTRTKLPWVAIPAGAQSFDDYYELARTWPPEAQARLQAAKPPKP